MMLLEVNGASALQALEARERAAEQVMEKEADAAAAEATVMQQLQSLQHQQQQLQDAQVVSGNMTTSRLSVSHSVTPLSNPCLHLNVRSGLLLNRDRTLWC
jgi:hypothetical protein